jgi:hypothetical protein
MRTARPSAASRARGFWLAARRPKSRRHRQEEGQPPTGVHVARFLAELERHAGELVADAHLRAAVFGAGACVVPGALARVGRAA